MNHLQAHVLSFGDDPSRAGQLPVGEDIPINELSCGPSAMVIGPSDAVVEQKTAVTEL